MNEPILIFETDSRVGTPSLQAANGAAKSWNQRDLHQLEDQLRPRYNDFVRDGAGTIEFKGQTLHVKRRDGDTSRLPTLELRTEEVARIWLPGSSSAPKPAPVSAPIAAPPVLDWYAGLLGEIAGIFESEEFDSVQPAEKAMLKGCGCPMP